MQTASLPITCLVPPVRLELRNVLFSVLHAHHISFVSLLLIDLLRFTVQYINNRRGRWQRHSKAPLLGIAHNTAQYRVDSYRGSSNLDLALRCLRLSRV